MSSLVYLITGANRGIGFGLTEALLKRPNTTVIAAVRDLTKTVSLSALQLTPGSRLITVKIESASESDPFTAVDELVSHQGITHIDVVIANAGISVDEKLVSEVKAKDMRDHWEVNALGPLLLFQATWPLLQKSKEAHPKFIGISSGLSSIGNTEGLAYQRLSYASSKAALNYIVRKIQVDHGANGLIAFPLNPGWAQTDMGNEGARGIGLENAPVTLKDSVTGLLDKIDNATTETFKQLISYDGEIFPW
ncbi:hypothetical protein BJ742DRAFT_892613 [Cladochytrium replicatum]|nr:hypothetical protein BJ742DRAFT_892613 [Cladochytrium replicatum]